MHHDELQTRSAMVPIVAHTQRTHNYTVQRDMITQFETQHTTMVLQLLATQLRLLDMICALPHIKDSDGITHARQHDHSLFYIIY